MRPVPCARCGAVIRAFYVDDRGVRYHTACWARRAAVLGCLVLMLLVLGALFPPPVQSAEGEQIAQVEMGNPGGRPHGTTPVQGAGGPNAGGAPNAGGGMPTGGGIVAGGGSIAQLDPSPQGRTPPHQGTTPGVGGPSIIPGAVSMQPGGETFEGGTSTKWNTQSAIRAGTNPIHFAMLLGAASIWILSFFFVGEAGKMAAWALHDEAGAPSADSGVFLSRVCSGAVILIWVFYVLIIDILDFGQSGEPMPLRIMMIALHRPIRFAPGFLVASILPAVVAVLKWSQAFATSGGGANTWKIVVVQMATYLLSMAASILVLFKNLKP